VSRQPIDLVAFAETYDIPAELDVYHWAQLLVSGIREATDRKEITCFRDGRTELPVVALQLIAELMPSSRSADVGFRFDRGVMTEVLVVVHEPTRNMLIEIQIVSGAATAGRYSFYPATNRVNRMLTVAATGMLMAALTVAPTINHHNLLFLPSGCVGLISWTACIGG
jgi:hypothetical protein